MPTPRLRLDDTGRVQHRIGADEISNDLAGWIADDLVAPGLIAPEAFERTFVDVVLSVDPDPDVAWMAFYRNTLAALARGGEPGGTNAEMAPVHARAVDLAVGRDLVELGCCFGFLTLQLAAAGHCVTAIDLLPGAARLLAAVAPRLRPADQRVHPADSREHPAADTPRVRQAARSPDSRCRTPRLAGTQAPTRGHGEPDSRGVGRVVAVGGDARAVPLADGCADTVYAAHLLEHLPAALAPRVLAEMLRVARRRVVVAVPFESEPNPTWGHVRTFDLSALDALGAATGHRYTVDEHHGGWLVIDR